MTENNFLSLSRIFVLTIFDENRKNFLKTTKKNKKFKFIEFLTLRSLPLNPFLTLRSKIVNKKKFDKYKNIGTRI